jgi:hypothetical protein
VIELANLAALAGAAVAAVPIVIHLAQRRRKRRLDWGAMRFLQAALAAKRRRLAWDRWLLLAVRTLLLVAVVGALLRPQWAPESAAGGPQVERAGRVAAALVLDDSPSTVAGDRIAEVRALALAYLDTLADGDSVSILPASRRAEPPGDPLYDLEAARALVRALAPTARGSAPAESALAGLDHLARHANPHAELVLVGDGRDDGWRDPAAFAALRERLAAPGARAGSRARPHLLLLHPEAAPDDDGNLAVEALAVDAEPVLAGTPAGLRIGLRQAGGSRRQEALLRVAVDGRTVHEERIGLDPGERREVRLRQTLAAGDHLVEARLAGHRDPLAADDARHLALTAEEALGALLVEGVTGTGLDGSLGPVAAMLEAGGGWTVQRLPALAFSDPGRADAALAGMRLAVVGDVAALDHRGLGALERFAAAGNGVLVVCGPATDPDHLRRLWWRDGDGVLPAAPGARRDFGDGAAPAPTALQHPALAGFPPGAAAAWTDVRIRAAIDLPGAAERPADAVALVARADGTPLVLVRPRGLGRAGIIATALDGSDGDLPWRPAAVPLIRGLAAWLAGRSLPERTLAVGAAISWPGDIDPAAAVLTGPDGERAALRPGVWEGGPALAAGPLDQAGGWILRLPGREIRYATVIDHRESTLAPLTAATVTEALQRTGTPVAHRPDQVPALVIGGTARVHDLWPWLLAAACALLLVEGWLCRRTVTGERRAEGPAHG